MEFKHSVKVPKIYKVVSKLLTKIKEHGGSVSGLISQANHPNKKGIMALATKTLQNKKLIDELLESSSILKNEPHLNNILASVLVTELLWGTKVLKGESKPVLTLLKYEQKLRSYLSEASERSSDECSRIVWRPRYVRVNTLKRTVTDVVNYFTKRGWKKLRAPSDYRTFLAYIKINLKDKNFIVDFHLTELLLFPFGTTFTKNPLYRDGTLVLQDKASCMISHVLNPETDSVIVDMCAAPGMKTTHLAAYIKNKGRIYAVERNEDRYKTLVKTVKHCGAKCVRPIKSDAFRMNNKKLKKLKYIVLDPSCSGTGMLNRLDFGNRPDDGRVEKLSNLQSKLLRHALTNFPTVKRVVYSTCSVHEEENESVVSRVLSEKTDFELVDCVGIFEQWSSRGLAKYEGGEKCLRSVAQVDCTNGFFIAAFERRGGDK